jgi:hypothetical protein
VQQLEQQLRWHGRLLSLGLVVAVAVAVAAFQAPQGKGRYTELDVERLNVIEPEGQLVLTLANSGRLPDPLIAGKTVETGRTGPGMIFFDGKGWEVGGLTYHTRVTANGYRAGGHFSFDQFRNDQVVSASSSVRRTRPRWSGCAIDPVAIASACRSIRRA